MASRNRIYGPVPSRRLGLSLGIDLVEYKHCPLDCIYCQLRETTRLDNVRETTVEPAEVIRQIRERIAAGPRPDHLTLGGSGEPTLYGALGSLIDGLHNEFDIPVALLTNGVMFCDPAVREEAGRADVVLPSLDAWDHESFVNINRPCPGLDFDSFMDGMISFRKEFGGRIWLEIMLLAGVSDNTGTVSRLAALASLIRPDRIQLNTPVRPPATSLARPLDRASMEELAGLFTPAAEVAADFPEAVPAAGPREVRDAEVLETITRRPCTARDVAIGMNMDEKVVSQALERLESAGLVVRASQNGRDYFKLPA